MAEKKETILEIEGSSGEMDDDELEQVAGGLRFNRALMDNVLRESPDALKVTVQKGKTPFSIINQPGGGVFWGVGGCGVGG